MSKNSAPTKTKVSKSSMVLIGTLAALMILYFAIRPALLRLTEDAKRLDQETDQRLKATTANSAGGQNLRDAKAAFTSNPNDPSLHLKLVNVLVESGDIKGAKQEVVAILKLTPNDQNALKMRGDLSERLHEFDDAVLTYRKMTTDYPEEAFAIVRLTRIYASLGWTRDAADLVGPFVNKHPDELSAKVAFAMILMQSSDLAKAEAMLADVRRRAPNDVGLWGPLIDVQNKSRRHEDAIKTAGEALALSPGNPSLLVALAECQFYGDHFAEASDTCKNLLNIDPNQFAVHYRLATCYQKLGNKAEYARELEVVFRSNPDYKELRLLLGRLRSQQGKTSEGAQLIAEYHRQSATGGDHTRYSLRVSRDTKDAEAHEQLAIIYKTRKDPERMKVELRKALKIDPSRKEAQSMLEQALADSSGQK